jgi:hypothetical protein
LDDHLPARLETVLGQKETTSFNFALWKRKKSVGVIPGEKSEWGIFLILFAARDLRQRQWCGLGESYQYKNQSSDVNPDLLVLKIARAFLMYEASSKKPIATTALQPFSSSWPFFHC